MKAHLVAPEIHRPWLVSASIFSRTGISSLRPCIPLPFASAHTHPQVDKKFLRNQKFAKLNNKAQQQ
jgi:hypothetical protein